MKTILSFLVMIAVTVTAFGQVPGIFNYQGVARNSAGNVLVNKSISLRLTIHDGSATGSVVYQESRAVITNPFGLFNIQVGSPGASSVSGTINGVNWPTGSKYIQVEIDPNGGNSFINIGTAQLASVPYALYATSAYPIGNAGGDLSGTYPNPVVAGLQSRPLSNAAPLTGQAIVWNGSTWLPGTGFSNDAWRLLGNTGTNPATNFIGTIDDQPLNFRINNQGAGSLSIGNTGFGYHALNSVTSGTGNTALGNNALNSTTTGNYNTATGELSLSGNTTGIGNTATGRGALFQNSTGGYNTATGLATLSSNTTGDNNTATGNGSLGENTTGYYNTATGSGSLSRNTTGQFNTATGGGALNFNTGGVFNTADGAESLLFNSTGNKNTAQGYNALRSNTTGSGNTAVGNAALYKNTLVGELVAVGDSAMYNNTTGTGNTAVGTKALFSNTTGIYNTAIGAEVLRYNTTGESNVGIGISALNRNTTGTFNIAIGKGVLFFNTTGGQNVAVGDLALGVNLGGYENTGLGYNALITNTTGSYNTVVGSRAGSTIPSGLNNFTAIGASTGSALSLSNTVEIGNTSVTWIGGQVPWSVYSDERIKQHIQANIPGLDFINRLRPVTYNLNTHKENDMLFDGTGNSTKEDANKVWTGKYDIESRRMSGFLAQEVEKAAKDAGYDFSGVHAPKNANGLYSLSYSDFVMPLVRSVQELNQKVELLEKENRELKALKSSTEEIAALKLALEQLKQEVGAIRESNK